MIGLPDLEANVEALAAGIRESSRLSELKFSIPAKTDEEGISSTADARDTVIEMKADMTEADFSSKDLGSTGAMIVAAFLPKCQ